MKPSTEMKVDNNLRPLAADTLPLTSLNDRRVLVFWLLEIAGIFHFIFWLIVASKVAGLPVSFSALAAGFSFESQLNTRTSSNATILYPLGREENVHTARSAQHSSVDVWFGLCFPVVVDAFAVVLTFNRALIRVFHNAVSQRLVFVACLIQWVMWSWNAGPSAFASRNPVACLAGGLLLYVLLGSALDKYEVRNVSPAAAARHGTFPQYSKSLGLIEISWGHAASLAAAVGGLALFLTWLIPTPWSAGLPVIQIVSESMILSLMGGRRTPRYVALCSPISFAVVCVHWGMVLSLQTPRLSLTPACFIGLVLLSRLLLDAHLRTVLRSRHELEWSRKNVLMSTPKLLAVGIVMAVLEYWGLRVITYIKPISTFGFFLFSLLGYMGAAAYNIAAKLM